MATLDVLERGEGLEPLPRGIQHPFFASVSELAALREPTRCFDPTQSRIERRDATSLPIHVERVEL